MKSNANGLAGRYQHLYSEVVAIEAKAVAELANRVPAGLASIVELILGGTGKVIITGMGKSGIIAKKIAATFSSTGTASFFVHPAEAYHGDLGMISSSDIVIAISNSGETEEILRLISYLQSNGNPLIAMTGNAESTLARNASFHLDISVASEACPLRLAPTSSTTVALVAGDALAMVVMQARGFRADEFAVYHPGGALGRRLLTRVREVMRTDVLPMVDVGSSIKKVVQAISEGRCGLAIVMGDGQRVVGVVSDGDLRRAMDDKQGQFFSLLASDVMTASPKTIHPSARLSEAEGLMAEHKIGALVVVDGSAVVGIVQVFDL